MGSSYRVAEHVVRLFYENQAGEMVAIESPPVWFRTARAWLQRLKRSAALDVWMFHRHHRPGLGDTRLLPLLNRPPERL